MNTLVAFALCIGVAMGSLHGLLPLHGYAPVHGHAYHGPAAPLGHDGRVIDTPEVAHAKAAHYEAYKNAAHENHAFAHGHAYAPLAHAIPLAHHVAPVVAHHGPAAPIGHDGRVVDTPEVAHAKAAHFAAHAAAAHGAHHYGHDWH